MKQWFGGSPAKTNAGYISGSHHYHWDEFQAAVRYLFELTETRAVELIYIDDEASPFVIAYRFTSDTAYDEHRSKLTNLVGGCGRGVWDVWHNKCQYTEFFGGSQKQPIAGKEATQ